MDTQKPNIDKYFEAARNSNPVISIGEVEELIANKSAGKTKSLTGIKTIIGVKPMYILTSAAIGAAVIGIIGIGISNFDDNKDIKSEKNFSPVIAKQQNEINASQPQKMEEEVNSVQDFDMNAAAMKKRDVKGVNIIELSKEELKNLGIKTKSDGSLEFAALKETKKPLLIKLSKDELTTIFGSEDADGLPGISPRFITDESGNRRLSLFFEKDNGSLVQAFYAGMYEVNHYGKSKSIRQMPAYKIDFDDEDTNNKSTTIIEIVQNNKKDYFVQKVLLRDGDSLKLVQEITCNYNPKLNGSIHKIVSDEELMKRANEKIILNDLGKVSKEYLETAKNYYDISKSFANKAILKYKLDEKYIDSIVEQSKKHFDNAITINLSSVRNLADSIAKEINRNKINSVGARIKIESWKEHKKDEDAKDRDEILIDKDIEINIDSIMQEVDSQIRNTEKEIEDIDIDIKIDTLIIRKLEKKLKKTEDSLKLEDEKFKQLDKKMKEMLKQIEENFESYIRINRLIPIAIKFDGSPYSEKFDYILWFDPSRELIEKLPAEIRRRIEPEILASKETKQFCEKGIIAGANPYLDVWRSCNGAIENMSVFPNPTAGKINVKFNLKSNRIISIVLHDLSGKQIRTLQDGINMHAGDFEGKFQLKGLEPGMYLLSVQSSSGEYAVQRLIIQ